jgi:UbiD family decarboxylase
MPFVDLRDFIEKLDEINELKRVNGADWNLEVGALTELMGECGGPALLFDKVKGYPAGYRIATNIFISARRMALALDLNSGSDRVGLVDGFRKKIKEFKPIPPVEVKTGPVKENVLLGKDVDLFKFPTPKWHAGDGGRFIGTGDLVITRDPDTGLINLGTYRVQIHDKTTGGMAAFPFRHGRLHMEKYWAKGLNAPVAVACGQDPVLFIMSTFAVPTGISEYDFSGWLRNKPIEVTKGEVTGLPIPATAEIVIEGEVPPPEVETRLEGPFGEYIGYYSKKALPVPVLRVKSILHRDDPILLGVPPVKSPLSQFAADHNSAIIWNELEKVGVPGVKGVWASLIASEHIVVVSIKQMYAGHAKEAGLAALKGTGRYVIVVDDDVDPTNLGDVLWAVGTRSDPEHSIEIIRNCRVSLSLDPRIPPEKKSKGDLTYSKAIIDACIPYHWKDEFPPVNKISQELREKMLGKWKDLF